MVKLRILLIVSMLMVSVVSAQANDYKLVKKSGLVSLYEKWITAMNGEQAREIKIVFHVNASPEQAVALLKDQSKGSKWNKRADIYNILAGANDNSWFSYVRYDLPWPVGDQDCCLQYSMKTLPTATEVLFQSVTHTQFPLKKGVGRISGTRGKWLFEKGDGAKMKVTYIVSANRNSKLPRVITDPLVRDNMIESMDLFTSLLEKK